MKRQRISIFLLLIGLFLLIHCMVVNVEVNLITEKKIYKKLNLKSSGFWELSPFAIDNSGGGDYTWAEAALEPWCSGSGNWTNPYLLENIVINASSLTNCLKIENSDVYFIIRNCTFEGGGGGVYLNIVNNGLIENNTFSNNIYGLTIYYMSSNFTIRINTFTNNPCGIKCYGTPNNITQNLLINNSGYGISLGSSSHSNIISGNTIIDTGDSTAHFPAGLIISSHHNIITNNKINNSYLYGIDLGGINNTIIDNTLYNNSIGLNMDWTRYNNISKNLILNNREDGIRMDDGAYNNSIWENLIQNNTYGIKILSPVDNLIYNNTFLSNIINARDNSNGDNYWNNSKIGNFWDDYEGTDANDDGIGDSPYIITGYYWAWDYLPIWYDGPTIQILDPKNNTRYGDNIIPPNFTIECHDPNLNSLWYTLNNGDKKFIIQKNGTIEANSWKNLPDGNVTISFYGNDTYGNEKKIERIIFKDTKSPFIEIFEPEAGSFFGSNAPSYNLNVSDLTLNTTWYTLDNGKTNYTLNDTIGIINQDAWNSLPDGSITLRFFANDSFSRENFETIVIEKDTIKPIINIIDPLNNTIYTDKVNPPNFTVEIFDLHLHRIWYIIPGNTQRYFISDNSTINEIAWINLSEGPLTIRFYVNDTLGNIAYEDVLLIIDFIEDQPPDDQPPDDQPPDDQEPIISFGNYYIIFILISLFSLIILMKVKGKHNRFSTLTIKKE